MWKKTVGFGLLIWIVMFVVGSIFGAYGMGNSKVAEVIIIVIMAVLAFVLAGAMKLASGKEALITGIVWVVIGLLLDYFITKRFVSGLYTSWLYWLGYVLVFLMPMFRIKKA